MTVKETFEAMVDPFQAGARPGATAVIQYDITGPEGCTYHVDIAEGQCALHERERRRSPPTLTLTMSAQDWLDMLGGQALRPGRLHVREAQAQGGHESPHAAARPLRDLSPRLPQAARVPARWVR